MFGTVQSAAFRVNTLQLSPFLLGIHRPLPGRRLYGLNTDPLVR
jgi:hypothetical protein